MTIRARIHGYTGWINMRLTPFNRSLSNVLMDLLRGTNMKYLLESYTGKDSDKIQSLENLTNEQVQTRVKWLLKDLKENRIIAEDVYLDSRLFAVRSAKHVFELLWRLVCHDIYFLWERIDFLSNQQEDILTSVPFTWVPTISTINKLKNRFNPDISELSGFSILEESNMPSQDSEFPSARFPDAEFIRQFSKRSVRTAKAPTPQNCIIQMINIQLKSVPEGKKIIFTKLEELSDTRVLCGLINSFVPDLFPTEILLNDRWSLNLILRSIDEMLMCNSTMDSEDLVEAEHQSLCAFFCYLFMMLYKYRQCEAVVKKYVNLEISLKKARKDLEDQRKISTEARTSLENKLAEYNLGLENLKRKYDIDHYLKWVDKVKVIKQNVNLAINEKLRIKFDWFPVTEDITMANLCFNQAINLTLTSGVGFYKLVNKEYISRDRKVIIKTLDNKNPKFYYNFEDSSTILLKMLRLPNLDPIEVNPNQFKNIQIFVECLSNNKILKKDTIFLYQVFPSSIMFYHNFLMRACLEKDTDAIRRLIEFFHVYDPKFIDLREPRFLNSALHICASNGYFSILLYLLENYANVNIKNRDGNTPLFVAANAFNRDCAKLLLEYGADVNIKNSRNNTVLTQPMGNEFRMFLHATVQHLSNIIPEAVKGDHEVLETILNDHLDGVYSLCTLKSRFLNGSTILHTCTYYGHYSLVKTLLSTTDFDGRLLNVDLKDYKGATALHRARDCAVIKLLVDFGANVNSIDLDDNTPLHARLFGERNQPSELDAIELLVYYKADILALNKKKLYPFHMGAMKGRIDALSLLLDIDKRKSIWMSIYKSSQDHFIHSPTFLAIINDELECAEWLIDKGFKFKENELNTVVNKILTGEIIVKNVRQVLEFVCQNGWDLNSTLDGGNQALHLAASLGSQSEDVIRLLIEHGAHVNALNSESKTALFVSVEANNPLAASTLLSYNADHTIVSNQGTTAFENIKDIDEWVKLDMFGNEVKSVLEKFEHQSTRNLIRSISFKINKDLSSRGRLLERNRTIKGYINQHNKMINNFYRENRSKSAK